MLAGNKFIPKLHLRQPGFTYIACGPFTKHFERIQKVRETVDLKHVYKNELDNTLFAHDVAYSNSNDLAKRTVPDRILKSRAYKIARNLTYDGNQKD